MFKLENIVRPNVQTLEAYSSARAEYKGRSGVFLDANENPYGQLNRYPDPTQKELKMQLSALKEIPIASIFVANGSDEVIDLAFRIFCQPREDKALSFVPTYGMYAVAAAFNEVDLIQLPLKENFQIDQSRLSEYVDDVHIKLILICSPNNPTGNTMNILDIKTILEKFKGVVLIDEAYIDFSSFDSWLKVLKQYPNLIICQTMSKAWGLAGARVGFAYASAEIIELFNKVKAPYNVSALNQKAAIKALANKTEFDLARKMILAEKEILLEALNELPTVKKVYPSDANFFLVEMEAASEVYQNLLLQNIITRNRTQLIKNCLRITIGSREENRQLIEALKKNINL